MLRAAIITTLLLLVLHWFPWHMLLRRKLRRLEAYVLGVLALVGPWAVLFWGPAVQAFLVVVMAGGGAVIGSYIVDHVLARMRLADELSELQRWQADQDD